MRLSFRWTGFFSTLITLIFALLMVTQTAATSVPDTPETHVVDLAGIVNSEAANKINQLLTELEEKTTAQVALLTVTSLEGQPIGRSHSYQAS